MLWLPGMSVRGAEFICLTCACFAERTSGTNETRKWNFRVSRARSARSLILMLRTIIITWLSSQILRVVTPVITKPALIALRSGMGARRVHYLAVRAGERRVTRWGLGCGRVGDAARMREHGIWLAHTSVGAASVMRGRYAVAWGVF